MQLERQNDAGPRGRSRVFGVLAVLAIVRRRELILTIPLGLQARRLQLHWSYPQSAYNRIGVIRSSFTTPLGLINMLLTTPLELYAICLQLLWDNQHVS